ncbi:MAG TPA: HEAT repeat domain-containing protein [Polyangia bacterium]|jgi:hypothetical protein
MLGGALARADKVEDLSRALLGDPSYKVRVQAALVLGKLGDRRAVPALMKAVKDDNPSVRGVSCSSLGRLGDPAAIPALKEAARDSEPFVRQAADKALSQLQSSAPAPAARARFYLNVGGVANKSKLGGVEAARSVREVLMRELGKTPNVTVSWDGGGTPDASALKKRKMNGYYLDGSIVRLTTSPAGSYTEVSCDLKMFIATWPAKSMIMFTTGGAAVQSGSSARAEEAARKDCLEAAAQAVHQNVVTFLKAQE